MSTDADNIADAAGPEIERQSAAALAPHERRRRAEAAAPINQAGICADCDGPISPARLAARPTAARCVECQGYRERRGGV